MRNYFTVTNFLQDMCQSWK